MMITIFTIPKPFVGDTIISQKNAISSWINCCKCPEILIYGDEEGVPDVASFFGATHIKEIKKNAYGTPYINDIFLHAQKIAKSDIICYINSDIIILSDITPVLEKMHNTSFLITGKRINMDITHLIVFSDQEQIRDLFTQAQKNGIIDKPSAMDYFIFPKGQIHTMPPFVVGRAGWDNWMIYHNKRELLTPIIDATDTIYAIHQNHDYSHVKHSSGKKWEGVESTDNRQLFNHHSEGSYSLLDADFKIVKECKLIPVKSSFEKRIHLIKRVFLPLIPFPVALLLLHLLTNSKIKRKFEKFSSRF